MTKYFVSNKIATGQVDVEDSIVRFAPPIWAWSVGKPLTRLVNWLRYKFGPTDWIEL